MQLTDQDFEAFDQMDREANAKMSERDFTRRLLPYLVPQPDQSSNYNVMEIYCAAAGHPNRMIDVHADNDPSKTLFTVPPLVSQTPMTIRSIHARPDTDIGELTAEYEAQITVNQPGMVIDGFVQRLMTLNYTQTDAISAVYGLMWASIYRRYSIPLSLMFGDNADKVSKVLGDDSSQDTTATQSRNVLDEIDDDDIEPL